ncbi:zinc ribbon domain-containing protein [Haloplanus halobius]|uniref:zinc ribbon domain-containing protein n=1 Tax=Haloplanus halobius TaxID=2934938 RepID=UPI0020102A20|nr:zinc ribbon domain-containing protein [Haloplanus sp. XH21]
MPLVKTLKQMFTAGERAVYRCDACGETFEAVVDAEDPSCTACGATEVRQINRL